MQCSTGYFCALLITLAACATPVQPPAPTPTPTPAASVTAEPVERGTVLAIRPVPAADPRTARILLSSLGKAAEPTDQRIVEYVVRAENGATISVVQDSMDGVRPGDRVSLQRGARTRIGGQIAVPGSH